MILTQSSALGDAIRVSRSLRPTKRGGRSCVESRLAQPSASWRSGGFFQRQGMPQAAPGCPRLRPGSANHPLGWRWHPGHIGLVFGMVPSYLLLTTNY